MYEPLKSIKFPISVSHTHDLLMLLPVIGSCTHNHGVYLCKKMSLILKFVTSLEWIIKRRTLLYIHCTFKEPINKSATNIKMTHMG